VHNTQFLLCPKFACCLCPGCNQVCQISECNFEGLRFYRGSKFPFFKLIFEWSLQQCGATAGTACDRIHVTQVDATFLLSHASITGRHRQWRNNELWPVPLCPRHKYRTNQVLVSCLTYSDDANFSFWFREFHSSGMTVVVSRVLRRYLTATQWNRKTSRASHSLVSVAVHGWAEKMMYFFVVAWV